MARVPYVDEPAAGGELAVEFETIEALFGSVVNFWRIIAHSPTLLRFMVPLSLVVQSPHYTSVRADLKRLAVLRTSMLNACEYCVSHNLALAGEQGIEERKLAALRAPDLPDGIFDDLERAVLAWADAVTHNTARRDGEAFDALRRHLTDAEIVELTVTIAHRNMVNRLQEALWTDLEDSENPNAGLLRPAAAPGADGESGADLWVRRILA